MIDPCVKDIHVETGISEAENCHGHHRPSEEKDDTEAH